jgi:ribosomal protein S18 acetylase RimI-like enzyme
MELRFAEEAEIGQLAKIWYDGWQEAHARILPTELAKYRTLESFIERLRSALPKTRVAGPFGKPLGFSIIKNDELYQLYVSAGARGTGVASALLADAEARLTADGVETAWLACAIGNDRAARFYERNGWRLVGNMVNRLETPDGLFPLEVWRYEKGLLRPSSELKILGASDMSEHDQRPPVGVAHVVLETDRMEESTRFMLAIGLRPIFDGPQVSVFEMRGGTHLLLMLKDQVVAGNAPFDLMVDDLRANHRQFTSLGLSPSPIEARPTIDHEVFTVLEPAGHVITFFSSHASGKPV